MASFKETAKAEGVSERFVRNRLSLAFLDEAFVRRAFITDPAANDVDAVEGRRARPASRRDRKIMRAGQGGVG